MPESVDRVTLRRAVRELASGDPHLARSHARLGDPPLWARRPGFATLVHIILEQQVSLASARAAFDRTAAACGGRFTPAAFLALSDETLRVCGFSRQKAGYARDLARAVAHGRLSLGGLRALDDAEARGVLEAQRGIGRWTADIYLLMALRRPDVWPATDLALVAAVREVVGVPGPLDAPAMDALADRWRPWRSVAARMLWHSYLASRGRALG